MHASRKNWVRYPQYKPTANGLYDVITSSGKVEKLMYSKESPWDMRRVLAFINVPLQTPNNPQQFKLGIKEKKKSLFREYMDAGKYTEFTDAGNFPATTPMRHQLNQLLTVLPDEQAMESLVGELLTLKRQMTSSNLESNSFGIEMDMLMKDVVELVRCVKSIKNKLNSMSNDLGVSDESGLQN